MTDKAGSLVCRVYVISDEGEKQIVKETADERCISAVMNWIVAHPLVSTDEKTS